VDAIFELAPGQGVLPGDLARLALERPVETPGFWVPLGALAEGDRGVWTNYVAVPLDGGEQDGEATHMIEARAVEVLYEREDRVYVRGAIDAGERVVVAGLHRIVPGQTVRVGVRQAMNETMNDATGDATDEPGREAPAKAE
jgi:hypothetical protein